MIRFTTLGAVDLRSTNGELLRPLLAQPRKVALLAYIGAVARGSPREREEIRAMFWPEDEDSRARHSLNQAVHVLRTELGGNGIESIGRTQIALDPNVVSCDVAEFYLALRDGDSETAHRCYGGEFLPGFVIDRSPGFERWLDRERAHLAREAAEVALKLALARERTGDAAGAAAYTSRVLELAPYDEGAVQRVLQLLARVGYHASAKRAFDEFARSLREDLELRPSPATLRLMQSLAESVKSTHEERVADRPTLAPRIAPRTPMCAPAVPAAAERSNEESHSTAGQPRYLRSALAFMAGALAVIALVIPLGSRPEKAAVHDGRDISRAQALRVYEHGRVEWNKRTPDALQAALSSFTEAARRDTTLPQAYSGIADAYAMLAWYGVMPSLDELQRAQAAAERAISLDPNLAEAHASLGNIYELVDHDETRARAEYSRAIELDGSYVAARDWFAFHLAAHGRIGEALRQMIAARSLAPRSVIIRTDLATMLFWARAYDQSLSELKQVATIDPSYRPMHYLLWRVNAALGKRSEALAALQVVMRDEGYSEPVVRGLRRAYAAGDWTTVLQRRLSAVERPSAHSRRRSIEAAALAVQLGRTDIAAFWLAQAHKEGNVALRFARFDPALDSVRDDPRVREILDVVTRSESKETNATR